LSKLWVLLLLWSNGDVKHVAQFASPELCDAAKASVTQGFVDMGLPPIVRPALELRCVETQ
jgi:hypothetical protein